MNKNNLIFVIAPTTCFTCRTFNKFWLNGIREKKQAWRTFARRSVDIKNVWCPNECILTHPRRPRGSKWGCRDIETTRKKILREWKVKGKEKSSLELARYKTIFYAFLRYILFLTKVIYSGRTTPNTYLSKKYSYERLGWLTEFQTWHRVTSSWYRSIESDLESNGGKRYSIDNLEDIFFSIEGTITSSRLAVNELPWLRNEAVYS